MSDERWKELFQVDIELLTGAVAIGADMKPRRVRAEKRAQDGNVGRLEQCSRRDGNGLATR